MLHFEDKDKLHSQSMLLALKCLFAYKYSLDAYSNKGTETQK